MSTFDPYSRYVGSTATIDIFQEEWRCELVEPNHPQLYKPADLNPFDDQGKTDWPDREQQMLELMHDHMGVGLSANQIGSAYRMFVMHHSYLGDIGVYNPRILETEGEVVIEEGCLTWPLLYLKKSRPERVKVTWTKNDGETKVETWMDGIDARCFLHEYEHLLGLTFIDDVSDFRLKRAKEKRDKLFKKLQRRS
jgi:peptide deformylase